MAQIVELQGLSDDKLDEMLKNNREELFNLRFQQASARLEDYARLKLVRREIAQLQTVLNNRQRAIDTAVSNVAELANFLSDRAWDATARYVYEDMEWQVEFVDESGDEIANATVDLNQKQPKGRRARRSQTAVNPVLSYEIVG